MYKYVVGVQAKVRAALAVNNVDYYVHPFMFSARPNTQPEFKVYVKKKDYDNAKYLIRDDNISQELLYTISEVATILKINKNFVYTLIGRGYLKSIKLGCRKVTRKSLLEFLEKYDGLNFDEILACETDD